MNSIDLIQPKGTTNLIFRTVEKKGAKHTFTIKKLERERETELTSCDIRRPISENLLKHEKIAKEHQDPDG